MITWNYKKILQSKNRITICKLCKAILFCSEILWLPHHKKSIEHIFYYITEFEKCNQKLYYEKNESEEKSMNKNNNNEEKNQAVEIIVNGRTVETFEKKLSYVEVIIIAFGSYDEAESLDYTVTYSKGQSNNKGRLLPGKDVPVKKGMVFNATKTTKS